MANQIAPYNEETEKALIGAILINPHVYLSVASIVKPDDFFLLRHTYIWEAMRKLESENIVIDAVTLSHELQKVNQLENIGGPAYLTSLIQSTPTHRNAEFYAELVKRLAKRRQLLVVCDRVKELAVDESIKLEDIFNKAESELLSVTAPEATKSQTTIDVIAHRLLDSFEQLRESGIKPGLPTGYKSIDEIIGGSYRGEVIVWAGPAKAGKSTVILNIARNRAKAGARIVHFITEMSSEAVTRKFVTMETAIPISVMKNVSFSPNQYSKIVESMSRVAQWPMNVIDCYKALTPLDIRRELRRIAYRERIDSVVIDGLWMMKSDKSHDARHREITSIMEDLVAIASDFNVPIDLVHQLKRAPANRSDPRPRLSDMGDSVGVERTAFTIIGLYREAYYRVKGDDDTEVIVLGNRDGNIGTGKLMFEKASESYHDIGNIPLSNNNHVQSPLPGIPEGKHKHHYS